MIPSRTRPLGGFPLPAGYTRLEYLETIIGDDHINTGIIPGGKILSAEVDASILEAGTDVAFLLGSVTSISSDEFRIGLFQGKNRVKLNSSAATGSTFDTSRKSYYINRPQGSGVGAEVLLSAAPVAIAEANNRPVYLFRSNAAPYPNGVNGNDRSRKRIYGCKIWDGATVVRNYLPAVDETGAPCMYDTVSRRAFYNSGTGDFIYPSTTATYSLRRVLPDWGKLTETGLRRLYHAPAGYKGDAYDYAMENGYKPIVEEPAPEVGYWAPVWHETEDSIQLEWVEAEPPADEELSTFEA